ncbi:MAG: RNA methyltransferase [Clostridia bacterium]|nr:RNA methyltransferase [Clostridia bacterium]
MPNIIEISDIRLPELSVFRLTDAQLRSTRDPNKAMFIAESAKAVSHAIDAGIEPVAFVMERRHITGQAAELLRRCPPDIPVYTGDRELLRDLLGHYPDRCIKCCMKRPPERALPDAAAGAKRVAVLENVTDPTNVGAVFRSAAALGIEAILLTPSTCDPLIRRAVRVSMGTVFQVPWARFPKEDNSWPDRGIEFLKSIGFHTAALALTDRSLPIDDICPANEERLAIILGAEGDGLSLSTIAACDYTLKIPMSNSVDSLNIAAAAAVAFWQLCR